MKLTYACCDITEDLTVHDSSAYHLRVHIYVQEALKLLCLRGLYEKRKAYGDGHDCPCVRLLISARRQFHEILGNTDDTPDSHTKIVTFNLLQ
jgi:hypothetical protein